MATVVNFMIVCVIVCESDEAYAMECAARCSLLLRGDAFVPW